MPSLIRNCGPSHAPLRTPCAGILCRSLKHPRVAEVDYIFTCGNRTPKITMFVATNYEDPHGRRAARERYLDVFGRPQLTVPVEAIVENLLRLRNLTLGEEGQVRDTPSTRTRFESRHAKGNRRR